MRRVHRLVLLAILLPLLAAGCAGAQVAPTAPPTTKAAPTQAPTSAPSPTQKPTIPPANPTSAPEKPTAGPVAAWQKKWDDTLAAAKKEGKVVVYGEVNPETRASLAAFEKKYGIEAEYVIGKSAELATKWDSERRGGLNLADVFIVGGGTSILSLKPLKAMGSLEPYVILPEVSDPKAWPGGKIPFLDKDKMVVPLNGAYTSYITVNTDLVKPGQLKSYQDLLKPEYKGKMVLYDATIGGGGGGWVTFIITDAYGPEKGKEYMTKFAAMEPAITKDVRQQVEWLAKAKYSIGIGAYNPLISEFRAQGAPLDMLHFVEGGNINPMSGCLEVSVTPAHPNAAALFINWMLTAEGQKAFMAGYKSPPARLDVPPTGVDPINLPIPGEKAFFTGENFYLTQGEAQKLAKGLFPAQ